MITSISIEAIEKQLLQQLSSFFFLSEEVTTQHPYGHE